MPAISVIMPVYNRQHTIARAIDSVLAQTFADFELILIDDASRDDSVRVIESYADPRIRLLRQAQNRGGGTARNRGIDEARSSLISFLDSDDVFLPHKLAYVAAYFAEHPDIDVLLDSYRVIYPPQRRREPRPRINVPMTDSAAIAAGIYARRVSKATPALSARRDALIAAGLFDAELRRRQDFDLIVRLTRCCRCATTDQVLWTKYWSAETITAQTHTFVDAMLEMCRRNPEYLTIAEHRVGLARDLAHHALRRLRKGQLNLLRQDLRRFTDAHGAPTTAHLLGQGLVENIRRGLAGRR